LNTGQYVPPATIYLMIEMNSIFLHIRQLMVFQSVDPKSMSYRAVAVLNMVTFIVFRVVMIVWMTFWVGINMHLLPAYYVMLSFFGLGTITATNMPMFVRLIKKDFLALKRTATTADNETFLNGSLNGVVKAVKKED
jgi:hypothetical protein